MANRVFAVGYKNFVEVREGVKPPRMVESQTVTVATVPVAPRYQYYTDDAVWGTSVRVVRDPPVKKKVVLKVICYKGGKVILSMKSRKFKRLTGLHVPKGGLTELTGENAALFTTGKWRDCGDVETDTAEEANDPF